MRKFLPILALLALGACATAGSQSGDSPRTRVARISADYLVVQEGIKAYLLLPPCGATVLPTCKSPAVVVVLQRGNAAASSALDYAEATVTTPGANANVIELAIGSAVAAVKSVTTTKSSFGVK